MHFINSHQRSIFWPRSNSYFAAARSILLSHLLIIPAISFVAPAAAASSGTCVLRSIGSFGDTRVDIIANSAASTTGNLEYECNAPTRYNSIQFCAYIQAANNHSIHTFFQTQDSNTRLAWQMRLPNQANSPLSAFGGGQATAGWTHFTNGWSPQNPSTTPSQQFTLTYLDRQQQDRVRSGIYTNSFVLVTEYKFGDGLKSSCSSGLSNPDGAIFTSFNVNATVNDACQLENLQDIDFGTQGSLDIASAKEGQIRAYGNIGIRCTYRTPYVISLSKGNNAENGIARVKSNGNYLPYQTLQPGCKIVWDDHSVLSGTGNTVNLVDNLQVCTQIIAPLAKAPAPGDYVDTIIVTATF